MKAILVTLAVAILTGVVFICWPARAWLKDTAAVKSAPVAAHLVGYDNPMVHSTLNVPWDKDTPRPVAHQSLWSKIKQKLHTFAQN